MVSSKCSVLSLWWVFYPDPYWLESNNISEDGRGSVPSLALFSALQSCCSHVFTHWLHLIRGEARVWVLCGDQHHHMYGILLLQGMYTLCVNKEQESIANIVLWLSMVFFTSTEVIMLHINYIQLWTVVCYSCSPHFLSLEKVLWPSPFPPLCATPSSPLFQHLCSPHSLQMRVSRPHQKLPAGPQSINRATWNGDIQIACVCLCLANRTATWGTYLDHASWSREAAPTTMWNTAQLSCPAAPSTPIQPSRTQWLSAATAAPAGLTATSVPTGPARMEPGAPNLSETCTHFQARATTWSPSNSPAEGLFKWPNGNNVILVMLTHPAVRSCVTSRFTFNLWFWQLNGSL